MHITSVVNPETNSAGDVCVLLLSYGDNMVFVGKPRTYEKLERVAREEFSLTESTTMIFETSTLDICRQQKVRISKGAYGAMWQCLDALYVAVKPTEKSSAEVQVTDLPAASSSHDVELPASSPASVDDEVASESDDDDDDDDDDAEEEAAEQPAPPRNRRVAAKRVMSTPPPEHGDANEEIPQEEDEDEGEGGPPSDSPSTEEPANEVHEQEEEPSTRAISEPMHEENNEEEEAAEEEEEEEAGANASAPVHEADVIDEQQETPESPRRPVARQESLDDQEWAEARASSIIRPPTSTPRTPLAQTASIPGTPTRSAAAQTPSSSQVILPLRRSVRSPRPAAPPVIAAHIYPPGSQASESSSRTVTPTYEPPHSQHLHITITIKKVLTSACGQFGLDPRRAALALERNTDSEITSTTCSPDMTLAACGVADGSQFIIRMD